MNKSLEKKLPQYTHRRVKTDLSIRTEQKKGEEPVRKKRVETNRRYQTEAREYRMDKQSWQTKIGFEDAKPHAKNNPYNLSYNKWYIKPNIRMKKSLAHEAKFDEIDTQFVYNKLYQQNTLREDCPFLTVKNSKLKLLQKIPVHNLRLLQTFKKNQELNKKRVPKIIELFLRKKGTSREQ